MLSLIRAGAESHQGWHVHLLRAAATEVIQERVRWVSSQMGISPTAARRYLTDDALADLARTMVVEFADETPGADVIESARTAAVPLPIVGLCIAGLAEAIQIAMNVEAYNVAEFCYGLGL